MDELLVKLMGLLDQLVEEKGVPSRDGDLTNKNISKSENSTFNLNNKKNSNISSSDEKRLVKVFKLFNKMFFDYKKQYDQKFDGKSSVVKLGAIRKEKEEKNPKEKGGFGTIAAIAAGVGILALALTNVFSGSGNVFKGIEKLGFGGALKIASSIFLKILNVTFLKKLPIVGALISLGMAILAFKDGDISTGIYELMSGLLNFVPIVGPFLSMGADLLLAWINGKGEKKEDLKTIATGVGLKIIATFFLKKLGISVLKKLPYVGGIISLGEAIMSFKEGNTFLAIGQLISGLLNFVPIVGPFLSMGADILLGWMESKGIFSEGGALSPQNGMTTIKNMMGSIGGWLMDHIDYLPIIGSFSYLGKAWDAFSSGDNIEGIMQLGYGILGFIGGKGLVKGIELLMGFFEGSSNQSEQKLTSDKSWFSKLSGWIKSKLKDLPWWIKKPLAWFGIISDDDVESVPSSFANVGDSAQKGFESIKDFTQNIWEQTKEGAKKGFELVGDLADKAWEGTKDFASSAWENAKGAATWYKDTLITLAGSAKTKIEEWIPEVTNVISGVMESALNVLKKVSEKIGKWISKMFGIESNSEDQKNNVEISKQENVTAASADANIELLSQLKDNSFKQVQLLGALVELNKNMLHTMGNMKGGSSSAPPTVINNNLEASSTKNMTAFDKNRDGYLSSAYALG